MKPLKDREEVEEVGPKETSEEEELGEDNQVYSSTVMIKVTWLGIVLHRDAMVLSLQNQRTCN
jgi:hypothetical protein